jgi:hypothetical protein
VNGIAPYTAPNGEHKYLVWGHEPGALLITPLWRRGVIYIYTHNSAAPSQSVWTKQFVTEQGPTQEIISVCFYNFETTISDGAIPANAEYAIYGNFILIQNPDYTNPIDARILASWNTKTGVVSALPIAANVGFDSPAPPYMIAMPTSLSFLGACKLIFYSPYLITHDGGTFKNICQYTTNGGGRFSPISGFADDGIYPENTSITSACFDYDNHLWLGGNFEIFQISGENVLTTRGLVCLSFQIGDFVFDNVMNNGIDFLDSGAHVTNIRRKYTGRLGVNNQLVVSGNFTATLTAGGVTSGQIYITTVYPEKTFIVTAYNQIAPIDEIQLSVIGFHIGSIWQQLPESSQTYLIKDNHVFLSSVEIPPITIYGIQDVWIANQTSVVTSNEFLNIPSGVLLVLGYDIGKDYLLINNGSINNYGMIRLYNYSRLENNGIIFGSKPVNTSL